MKIYFYLKLAIGIAPTSSATSINMVALNFIYMVTFYSQYLSTAHVTYYNLYSNCSLIRGQYF